MKIREMMPQDYDAADERMRRLHSLHVAGRPDLYTETEHPYSREEFEAIIACGQCIALAAEEDGKIVGICFAAIHERDALHVVATAYLESLYVDEAARRKGVAAALLRETEHRAKKHGAQRLELMVWDFNRQARAFYEVSGMSVQRYILEKEL